MPTDTRNTATTAATPDLTHGQGSIAKKRKASLQRSNRALRSWPLKNRQLATLQKNPGKLTALNYYFDARSDSLCGALFCRTLTR